MTDREKVIKGLQGVFRCVSPVNHTCGDCPYQDNHVGCIRRVLSDALALLKAQEPHVLTLEEACGRDYCFYEYRAAGYIEPASVVMSGLLLNDSEPLVEVFKIGRESPAYVAMKYYGREWRCWDRMPEDGQKEGEPWN